MYWTFKLILLIPFGKKSSMDACTCIGDGNDSPVSAILFGTGVVFYLIRRGGHESRIGAGSSVTQVNNGGVTTIIVSVLAEYDRDDGDNTALEMRSAPF